MICAISMSGTNGWRCRLLKNVLRARNPLIILIIWNLGTDCVKVKTSKFGIYLRNITCLWIDFSSHKLWYVMISTRYFIFTLFIFPFFVILHLLLYTLDLNNISCYCVIAWRQLKKLWCIHFQDKKKEKSDILE